MGESQTAGQGDEAAAQHPLLRALAGRFGARVLGTHAWRGDVSAVIEAGALLEVARFLRDGGEAGFDMLLDVTAVDYLGRAPRFEVVYHLVATTSGARIRLKVPLDGAEPALPSLVSVWPGANWLERETFDMYGIRFEAHPDLRRIYLYDEFEGHPLRKDYPKQKRQPLIGPGSRAESGSTR